MGKGKKPFPVMALCGGIFLVLIGCIGLLDALWPKRGFSELENRELAQAPAFSWKKLWKNEYTPEYEKYIGDQFVLRDQWISVKSRAEWVLGKLENNGVIYGKDGYQFEKLGAVEEERVQKAMGYVGRFAAALPEGTRFYFGVIPNAYEVLPDLVPAAAPLPDQGEWIERIYGAAPEGTALLDITAALAQRAQEPIFYHSDHHWTTLGAYYGYEAYCKEAGLTPVALESLTHHRVEGFYGTLYSKSKLFSTQPEGIDYYDTPAVTMTIRVLEGEKVVHSLYDTEQFEGRDKYAAFLYSNNDLTRIERDEPTAERGKLLIIKDSYSNSMIPFLTNNYNEIVVIDLRGLSVPMSQLLAAEGFDDVLLLYNFKNFVTDVNLIRLTW